MGSNQSVGLKQIQIQICHPRFKNASIFIEKGDKTIISYLNTDKQTFENWQQRLRSSSKLSKEYLILPIEANFQSQRLCSNAGECKVVNENLPYLLKDEIYDRVGKGTQFSEEQLWFLLFCLIKAKREFQQKKVNSGNIGDIKPENIFLSEAGSLKVASILSWPGEMEAFQKIIEFELIESYLPPEEITQLSLGVSKIAPKEQSQIFAIGMTVLSAVLLSDNFDVYRYQNKSFNYGLMATKIASLKEKSYSELLTATVELLCEVDPESRLSTYEIDRMLSRHEMAIKSRTAFTVSWVPEKIEQKIKSNRKNKLSIPLKKSSNQFLSPGLHKNSGSGLSNSASLSQAILSLPSPVSPVTATDNQSLFSSMDQFYFDEAIKRQSNSKQPSEHYQIINKNEEKMEKIESLKRIQSTEDLEDLALYQKQVIVQNPVVVDVNRKSNDIEDQVTPSNSWINYPQESQNESGLHGVLGEPLGDSIDARGKPHQVSNSRFVKQTDQKIRNEKVKTNVNINGNLVSHSKAVRQNQDGIRSSQPNKFNIRQSKSYDNENEQWSKLRNKHHNTSVITNYIPISNDPNNSSLVSSTEFLQGIMERQRKDTSHGSGSSGGRKSNHNENNSRARKIDTRHSPIPEISKDSSEIQVKELTPSDKLKIKQAFANLQTEEAGTQEPNSLKKVRFDNEHFLDQSHQSHILEIDDVNLDCFEEAGNQKGIKVEYRLSNDTEFVIESVKVSLRNSQTSDITTINHRDS